MAAILTVNAGSSSVKFSAWRRDGAEPERLAEGQVEALGDAARLVLDRAGTEETRALGAADHAEAMRAILSALDPVIGDRPVAGVGHRIVHGGPDHAAPLRLTAETRAELGRLAPLAPLHQPHNLAAVDAAIEAFPQAVQIGCFDTAFHRGHDFVTDTFALPRRFYDDGVRRYGFHGLSYDHVAGRLAEIAPALAGGRVIVAHLGNGASLCALKAGRSVATTMGFSALDGLPMGTRCGQIDPGVLLYLMDRGMGAEEMTRLLYRESGLLGLSGISHDMRVLLDSDAPEAAEAVAHYVARIRREIGALAAQLGGLDGLVFTAGVGENAAPIRARVAEGMGWLGLAVDPDANAAGRPEIGAGPVRVLIVPTDEERVIARAVSAALA